MEMSGMVTKMRPLTELDIPAGPIRYLEAWWEHIMLMGLNRPLHEGQSFPLTLTFELDAPRTVTVAVEKTGCGRSVHQAAEREPDDGPQSSQDVSSRSLCCSPAS